MIYESLESTENSPANLGQFLQITDTVHSNVYMEYLHFSDILQVYKMTLLRQSALSWSYNQDRGLPCQ